MRFSSVISDLTQHSLKLMERFLLLIVLGASVNWYKVFTLTLTKILQKVETKVFSTKAIYCYISSWVDLTVLFAYACD